jgi:hypothetical protein
VPRGVDRYDEALRQGRLWTPQVILPALGCWYDAGDISTVETASGTVSTLRDKSGRGRHATATDRPSYISGPPPCIRFTGTQFLQTTADTDTLYDYFVVAKPASGGYCTLLCSQAAGGNLILLDTGTNNLGTYTTTSFVSSGKTWPDQMGLLYNRITYDGSFVRSGFARDGEATIAYVNTTGVAGGGGPALGNAGVGGAFQAWGDVHEAMSIISTDTSNFTDNMVAFRSKFEGYAAWRWTALGAGNMVSLLPASHLFKKRPPLIGD